MALVALLLARRPLWRQPAGVVAAARLYIPSFQQMPASRKHLLAVLSSSIFFYGVLPRLYGLVESCSIRKVGFRRTVLKNNLLWQPGRSDHHCGITVKCVWSSRHRCSSFLFVFFLVVFADLSYSTTKVTESCHRSAANAGSIVFVSASCSPNGDALSSTGRMGTIAALRY